MPRRPLNPAFSLVLAPKKRARVQGTDLSQSFEVQRQDEPSEMETSGSGNPLMDSAKQRLPSQVRTTGPIDITRGAIEKSVIDCPGPPGDPDKATTGSWKQNGLPPSVNKTVYSQDIAQSVMDVDTSASRQLDPILNQKEMSEVPESLLSQCQQQSSRHHHQPATQLQQKHETARLGDTRSEEQINSEVGTIETPAIQEPTEFGSDVPTTNIHPMVSVGLSTDGVVPYLPNSTQPTVNRKLQTRSVGQHGAVRAGKTPVAIVRPHTKHAKLSDQPGVHPGLSTKSTKKPLKPPKILNPKMLKKGADARRRAPAYDDIEDDEDESAPSGTKAKSKKNLPPPAGVEDNRYPKAQDAAVEGESEVFSNATPLYSANAENHPLS